MKSTPSGLGVLSYVACPALALAAFAAANATAVAYCQTTIGVFCGTRS